MSSIGRNPVKDRSRGKIILVGVLFWVVLLGLWARAYYLQIVMGPEYASLANNQYWASEIVAGKRGEIFDRNGLLLAKSITTQSVYAHPYQIRDPWTTARRLGQILGKSKEISAALRQKKKFVWIERKISDAQAQAIREEGLPGVYLVAENSRQYPQGRMAGQLLGFLNIDGQGIEGLEKRFNAVLRPSSIKRVVQRDASGQRLSSPEAEDPATYNGQNLHLTLDSQIQLATEEALERSVHFARASSGLGMVVEVGTGEILAWAHYPFFNPNVVKKISGEWKNRLAVGIFEPGSTMKPLMVAAALQEKVCTARSVYDCENGKWSVADRRIKDTHKYGKLTTREIVRYSSNIGAAKIGLALGATRYESYLRKLGFGRATGLPLPGEAAGLLRPRGEWNEVYLANMAFGQGVAVTVPQMVEGYLCLANGGVRQPLRLLQDSTPPVSGERVFDPQVAQQVMTMLEGVVQEDGTGTQARIQGVRVAGKTGTAQKASPKGGYGSEYVASFVAIFPADAPRYLVFMLVDEPQNGHYGGVLVAPEARNVGVQLLTATGMLSESQSAALPAPTDRLMVQVQKNPDSALGSQDVIPDFRGATVRQALEALVEHGIVPEVRGRGVFIERQKPLPGEKWATGMKCQLWLTGQPG